MTHVAAVQRLTFFATSIFVCCRMFYQANLLFSTRKPAGQRTLLVDDVFPRVREWTLSMSKQRLGWSWPIFLEKWSVSGRRWSLHPTI